MTQIAMRGWRTRALVSTIAAGVMLGGCATASKDIATAYVSPMQYQPYDCDQLAAEAARIHSRVSALGGRLDQAAKNDAAITGVGVILFWPALFFLGGTKEQEAEYARLKGEYEAVQQAANAKKCILPAVATPAAGPASAPGAASAPAPQ
jgi:hypothetical protein